MFEVLGRRSGSRLLGHSRNVHFDKLTLEDKKGSKKIFNRGFFVRAKASNCVQSQSFLTSNGMGEEPYSRCCREVSKNHRCTGLKDGGREP